MNDNGEKNPIPIVGYCDKLSVKPGETLKFMVSCDFPSYRAGIVRMRSAGYAPKGPPRKEENIQTNVSGEYRGRKQVYPHGSYAIAPRPNSSDLEAFSVQCWIYSTTPKKGLQGIVTSMSEKEGGIGLFVDREGAVALGIRDTGGQTEWIGAGKALRSHCWYFVAATFDSKTGKASVYQIPLREFPGDESRVVAEKIVKKGKMFGLETPLLIGASWGKKNETIPVSFFNGKVENPRIFSRALDSASIHALKENSSVKEYGLDLLADWDFSKKIGSEDIIDKSGYRLHGKVVNCPKRAVTSHNWSGDDFDFKHNPEQYAAIYFHDDDLDDCKWEVDFTLDVPLDFKSGIYAAKLESNNFTQHIPFFVRTGEHTKNKIAFLVPTLSYLAYGDEHILSDPEQRATVEFPNFEYPTRPMEKYLIKNRLHSLYDKHSDLSGVCYSSRWRPVLSIGPEYISAILAAGKGSPHQFSADLLIIDWMEEKGFSYDILTDEDLHWEGASVLRPYKAVVSGTHHEYWSSEMLDSLEEYLNGGGRFMYMGGNGFYWVTAVDPVRPHVIEIRRWGGTQTWHSDPGEFYLSSTGEMGGLWRNRGRAPQKYVGVGFDSQGFDVNIPYRRTKDSFDPRASFIFEGIGEDELIGDSESLIQTYGAAGYEIDRVDEKLGTPVSTLVVATAEGFSDGYLHVIEENDTTLPHQGGTEDPQVRSDMVYCKYPNEGAVFSTASISWAGCLYYNNYNNTASKVTENVLRRFSTTEKL